MDILDLKGLIHAEDHTIVIKIENFSTENNDSQEESFIPELFNGLYAFSVRVFPNGSCPISAGHVSLLIKSSMTSNQDLGAMGSSNSMSCTASVVDVGGERRYSQSFGIDNLIFPDSCIPGLERFIKRSTLLSQNEELLPDDVLTIQFEFSLKRNHEMAMLSKITEFLPSLFVERGRGGDNNGVCDFAELFRDIEDKSDDECNGFECVKSFDHIRNPNTFEPPQPSGGGMHQVTDAVPATNSEIHRENVNTKAIITEMHEENENVTQQEYDAAHISGTRIQKYTIAETSDKGKLKENEINPTSENVEENEGQKYNCDVTKNETELIEIIDEEDEAEVQCGEMRKTQMEENFKERLRHLDQTGDQTSKNIIIVVNGHRLFQKYNPSHKNTVDFHLTTDEELYKMYYSTESLDDEDSKSIYRMHTTVPFFTNLMDRDENALYHDAENGPGYFERYTEENDKVHCSFEATKPPRKSNESLDDKKAEKLHHFSSKIECTSVIDIGTDFAQIQPNNFTERRKSTSTSEKNIDKSTEKKDSSNEEKGGDDNKFDFLIQTADNLTILVPFEDKKETIGSKLLSVSTVFENMLKHPMNERSDRRVELIDASSRTVNNLLSYVDIGEISDIPLPDAYDLYEAADKYGVKNLMKVCADFMAYFPIRENVWSMVKLAEMHSDDYLLELAESLQKLVFRLEQTSMKKKNEFIAMFGDLIKDPEISLEVKPTQNDFFAQDFNFYQ